MAQEGESPLLRSIPFTIDVTDDTIDHLFRKPQRGDRFSYGLRQSLSKADGVGLDALGLDGRADSPNDGKRLESMAVDEPAGRQRDRTGGFAGKEAVAMIRRGELLGIVQPRQR